MEIDILGERLLIRASEDPQFVGEVAELVKLRLREANRRLSGTPNKNRVLLLALLDLAEARADGVPITAETCPHYLTFESEQIPDGATHYKCCHHRLPIERKAEA